MPTSISIRKALPADAGACGQIYFDAFSLLNGSHGFPCDVPSPDVAVALHASRFSDPGFYCVVAERQGTVVGSNIIDVRSVIAGIGPLAVMPAAQNSGVGRMLMQHVMDHVQSRGVAGIRLVQAAFHNRSLSLYSTLGFEVREPLACMQGRISQRHVEGCAVRPARAEDIDSCNALSRRVHGFGRSAELSQAIAQQSARVVERGGRITGHTTELAFRGHAVAESNQDLEALIASAESFGGSGILVPARNHALLRWCLVNGLRIVQPMTLMTMGLYNEPAGAWLASILF